MATYETDNLKNSKPGETAEKQNGKVYPAGVYRHPQSGQEAITLEDPLYRNAQSEAFARVGFVRIRDAKPEEIKTLPQLAFERKERVEMGGDEARLTKIERDQAVEKAARLEKELAEARGEKPEETKQEEGSDEEPTTPALADSNETEEKPLSQQNKTELQATAEAEGVELDLEGEHDTNKKIVAAIETAREEKEGK